MGEEGTAIGGPEEGDFVGFVELFLGGWFVEVGEGEDLTACGRSFTFGEEDCDGGVCAGR